MPDLILPLHNSRIWDRFREFSWYSIALHESI